MILLYLKRNKRIFLKLSSIFKWNHQNKSIQFDLVLGWRTGCPRQGRAQDPQMRRPQEDQEEQPVHQEVLCPLRSDQQETLWKNLRIFFFRYGASLIDVMNILQLRSWDSTYRLAESLAPLTIRPISSTPKKGFQSPKAFICPSSHWINPMYGYSHTHVKYNFMIKKNRTNGIREEAGYKAF